MMDPIASRDIGGTAAWVARSGITTFARDAVLEAASTRRDRVDAAISLVGRHAVAPAHSSP